jgi:hypothetical protein
MASAGFHYAPTKNELDYCLCPFCGVSLANFEPDDNPRYAIVLLHYPPTLIVLLDMNTNDVLPLVTFLLRKLPKSQASAPHGPQPCPKNKQGVPLEPSRYRNPQQKIFGPLSTQLRMMSLHQRQLGERELVP